MTGANLLAAYSEIALDDRFPVLGVNGSGVDNTQALAYLNIAARRVMTMLQIEAKATFTFTSGTAVYAMTTFSTPLYQVNKVKVADAWLERSTIEDAYGWYANRGNLIFNEDFPTSTTVTVYGYQAPATIANNATSITDIPEDVHLAVAQLAIVEGVGSHREEFADVKQMERIALDSVGRYLSRNMGNTAPIALFNGDK
jgi:hypothetical protein